MFVSGVFFIITMLDFLENEITKNFPQISEKILQGLQEPSIVSIKLNPFKIPEKHFFEKLEKVPWSKFGYYLQERPSFVNDPLWHCGAYYVQEASSMFLDFIIQEILKITPKNFNWKILDLCAAPGGKTWSLASNFPIDSFVLANEIDPLRINILKHNVSVLGFPNIYISNNQPNEFPKEPLFDFILVDAPCSGEGMFRKHSDSLKNNLNHEYIQICAKRQKNILHEIKDLITPGGYLVYSTCTFNLEENEKLINEFLSQNHEFETFELSFPKEWNIFIGRYQKSIFYRFFPGITRGEGFSITILRKKGSLSSEGFSLPLKKNKHSTNSWIKNHLKNPENYSFFFKNQSYFAIKKNHFAFWEFIQTELKMIKNGILIGNQKSNDFLPEQEWVWNIDANDEIYPKYPLDKNQAIKYLSKETFKIEFQEIGINIMMYQGIFLGLANNIGKRWNNLLPKIYKIRKSFNGWL